MRLVTELRKNNGQFDYEHFIDNMGAYERAFKSLLNNREWALLYSALSCYVKHFYDFANSEGVFSYRPGDDYVISYYSFYLYAQIMEKGIRGVVKKDKQESDRSYSQLLRRFERVPNYLKKPLLEKVDVLLRCAYPDLMDNFSDTLYYVGNIFYKKKDYKTAFKLFKKGADFDCSGRQIVYPYYLIAKNQDRVADMYRYGLGVEKDIKKAIKYYKECASNCGRKHHPKCGDFHLERKRYSYAFVCYTCINRHWPWRYSTYFMRPKNMETKLKTIFNGLSKMKNRDDLDTEVLYIMYKLGLGCEQDVEKSEELLPNAPEWVEEWAEDCWTIF